MRTFFEHLRYLVQTDAPGSEWLVFILLTPVGLFIIGLAALISYLLRPRDG